MIVDFMIIGAQKCGTTSLASQLASHPQICFSRIKEPAFFNSSQDWLSGIEQYHSLFQPSQGQVCGEASTMYTFQPEFLGTPERIHAYNPAVKLIYMMRDPVERIISNYTHDLVRGSVQMQPESVVFADPAYINRSRYAVQIRPYFELFGQAQILLLVFEEYVQDAAPVLVRIAEFLNVDPALFLSNQALHAHKSVGEVYLKHEVMRSLVRTPFFQSVRGYIPSAIRQPLRRSIGTHVIDKPQFSLSMQHMLWRFVEDDVNAVEELLGRRLDVWREREWLN